MGRYDSDRLSDIHRPPAGKISSVAFPAETVLRFAGENRPYPDAVDTRFVDPVRGFLGDFLVGFDYRLTCDGVPDRIKGVPADDTLPERFDNFLAFLYRRVIAAVDGSAIILVDDDILGYVDEPSREVTRIGGLESRIGKTFSCTVRRDEEFDDRKPFPEIRTDRQFDDVAGRFGHETPHAGKLSDLVAATPRAGVRHHVNVVESVPVLLQRLHHHGGQVFIRLRPDFDDPVVPFLLRYMSGQVLRLDRIDLLVGGCDHLGLLVGNDDIVHADGCSEERGVPESVVLDGIEHGDRYVGTFVLVDRLDERAKLLVAHLVVDVWNFFRQSLVEKESSGGSLDERRTGSGARCLLLESRPDRRFCDRYADESFVVA